MTTIEELRKQLLEIGGSLGKGRRPNGLFIIPDKPDGLATPYLEIHGVEYHFVVSERGQEFERKITTSAEEILYWFVETNVSTLASDYAAKHTPKGVEFRRVYFRKQYELLKSLNPNWAELKRKELIGILLRTPFSD